MTREWRIINVMDSMREHTVQVHVLHTPGNPVKAWTQTVQSDADFFAVDIDEHDDGPTMHTHEVTALTRFQRLQLLANAPFTSFITANIGFHVSELEDGVLFIHGADPQGGHSTPSHAESDNQTPPAACADQTPQNGARPGGT